MESQCKKKDRIQKRDVVTHNSRDTLAVVWLAPILAEPLRVVGVLMTKFQAVAQHCGSPVAKPNPIRVERPISPACQLSCPGLAFQQVEQTDHKRQ